MPFIGETRKDDLTEQKDFSCNQAFVLQAAVVFWLYFCCLGICNYLTRKQIFKTNIVIGLYQFWPKLLGLIFIFQKYDSHKQLDWPFVILIW